ncbi:hypothetical protein Droror1_Dr00020471 [Drosera rotundifolia]
MGDIEIEVLGDLHQVGGRDRFYLCMGKVMTSDEENMIRSGMKQLHRNLGLFKTLTYKGTSFFVHGINL